MAEQLAELALVAWLPGAVLFRIPTANRDLRAGLPAEGIGILLGADTIPDMFRTTANVTGHMAVATAVAGKRANGPTGR